MKESKKSYVDEPRHSSPAGLIIRQKELINLEMPFDQVESYLTPTATVLHTQSFPGAKARRRQLSAHDRWGGQEAIRAEL